MLELIDAMERSHADANARAQNDFETAREEIKNRNGEEYNALRLTLESSIDQLEKALRDAHDEYVDETGSRSESFKELTAKDVDAAATMAKRSRRIDRMQAQLAHWRRRHAATEAEWAERNETLRKEKENMQRHYRELTKKMKDSRTTERSRLGGLVEDSAEASKAVDAKIARAEKILKLAEMARKLETEGEKIDPFNVSGRPYADVSADAFQTPTQRALAEAYARCEAARGMADIEAEAKAFAAAEVEKRAEEIERPHPGLLAAAAAERAEKEDEGVAGTFEHGRVRCRRGGSLPAFPTSPWTSTST